MPSAQTARTGNKCPSLWLWVHFPQTAPFSSSTFASIPGEAHRDYSRGRWEARKAGLLRLPAHLLPEKPASTSPNSHIALLFHVESNVVPPVQGSWSRGDVEVGCALGLLGLGLL